MLSETVPFQEDSEEPTLAWNVPKMVSHLRRPGDLQGWPGASLNPDQWSLAKSREKRIQWTWRQRILPWRATRDQVWVLSPLAHSLFILPTTILNLIPEIHSFISSCTLYLGTLQSFAP